MRTTATITSEYLEGIATGRELLKTLQAQGFKPADIAETIPQIIANLKASSKGQPRLIRDLNAGEVAFWRNQLRTRR